MPCEICGYWRIKVGVQTMMPLVAWAELPIRVGGLLAHRICRGRKGFDNPVPRQMRRPLTVATDGPRLSA